MYELMWAQLISVLINHVPLQTAAWHSIGQILGHRNTVAIQPITQIQFPNFSTPRHQCTYANNTHLIFQIHHHTSVVNAYSVVWDFRPQDIAALLQIAHVHALQVLAPIMGVVDTIITKLAWVTIAQYFFIWKGKGQSFFPRCTIICWAVKLQKSSFKLWVTDITALQPTMPIWYLSHRKPWQTFLYIYNGFNS